MSQGGLFNPDNFGQGFFDNVDAECIAATVGLWKEVPDKTFAIVTYRDVKATPEDSNRVEYYSIGPTERFTPSPDGTRAVYEDGSKMNAGAKFAVFLRSLVNCGFPKSEMADDIRWLIGKRFHLASVEMDVRDDNSNFMKQRAEKAKKDGKDAPSGKPRAVIATKWWKGDEPDYPWKGKAAPGTSTPQAPKPNGSAGAPTPAAAPAQAAQGGADDAAAEAAIAGLLKTAGGSLNKRALPNKLFPVFKDADQRKSVIRLAGNNDWLGADSRPWMFDPASGDMMAKEE